MRVIIIATFLFTSFICNSQNYITDYHQKSILAHEHVLKAEYFEAIALLENCIESKVVHSPELYTLGISYVVTGNRQLGKEYIYKSYSQGHTNLALRQDSALLQEYLVETNFVELYDSCLTLILAHDNQKKIVYEKEENEIEKIYVYRWRMRPYLDSIREVLDSVTFGLRQNQIMQEYNNGVKSMLDFVVDSCGWKSICDLVAPRNFSFLILTLDDEYIQKLVLDCYEELVKGNVSPRFYSTLYDLLEKRYSGSSKYSKIAGQNLNMTISEIELLKSDCFQIGLGSREVIYLMYREYSY